MDFRLANDQAKAERERRMSEHRTSLRARTTAQKRVDWLKWTLGILLVVLMATLQQAGFSWAAPAVLGVLLVWIAIATLRRHARR